MNSSQYYGKYIWDRNESEVEKEAKKMPDEGMRESNENYFIEIIRH